MSQIIVSNLGKAYKQYPSRWARLREWIGPRHQRRHQLQWILEDINFRVLEGEAVGIIGINGAGKSTLLKLISGTTQPTTGSIQIKGHIAALLELGMGFHPDFTGRQNVYMAGQLLGLTEKYIDNLMPEIEAFAEIGDYIDQPVRVYSSGMQVRLAFSVATAHRPDVLIVDEALSVGDAYFQHKSFERIREFREQGTTLLIVSHDRNAILSLCDRAVLLKKGRIIKDGKSEEIFDFYNALIAETENSCVKRKHLAGGKIRTISGSGDAQFEGFMLCDRDGKKIECVAVGEPIELRIRVRVRNPIPTLVFGYSIKDRLGQVMYGTNTWHTNQVINSPKPGDDFLIIVAFQANLGVGSYSVQAALHATETHLSVSYEMRSVALVFEVVNVDKTSFVGCQWNEPNICINELKS